jgi:hypothetical protein
MGWYVQRQGRKSRGLYMEFILRICKRRIRNTKRKYNLDSISKSLTKKILNYLIPASIKQVGIR